MPLYFVESNFNENITNSTNNILKKNQEKAHQMQSVSVDILLRWPRILSTVKQIPSHHFDRRYISVYICTITLQKLNIGFLSNASKPVRPPVLISTTPIPKNSAFNPSEIQSFKPTNFLNSSKS